MEMSSLTRNPSAVSKTLKVLEGSKKKDPKSVMTTKGCKIYVPARYRNKNFANIGRDIYILGIYMMVVGNNYSISNVITMVKITPDLINETTIDGVEFIEFAFDPGSVVIPNINVVMQDKLPYYVYDEFISKGNVPIFFEYNDLLNLFKKTPKYSGVSLASSPTILHMVLSMIARDKNDLHQFFRSVANGKNNDQITYIPLTSNTHGANNTTSRLMGAHFKDNITTALSNPAIHEENYEHNLRI